MRLGSKSIYWIAPWKCRSLAGWLFFTNVIFRQRIYRVLGFDIYPTT